MMNNINKNQRFLLIFSKSPFLVLFLLKSLRIESTLTMISEDAPVFNDCFKSVHLKNSKKKEKSFSFISTIVLSQFE